MKYYEKDPEEVRKVETATNKNRRIKMEQQHVIIDHPVRLGFAVAFGFWLFTLLPAFILFMLVVIDLAD